MSSILGFSGHANTDKTVWTKEKVLALASKFQDQGDYQDLYEHEDSDGLLYLVHNRLVTVGLETTTFTEKDNLVVAFDGEIFNYQKFDDLFKKTGSMFESDTSYEFMLYAYRNLVRVSEEGSVPDEFVYDLDGDDISDEERTFITLMTSLADGDMTLMETFSFFLQIIQGDFSFVLHDIDRKKSFMVRKGVGTTPLYYGITQFGEFMIASEKKVLIDDCILIVPFTPNSFVYANIIGKIPVITPIIPLAWNRETDGITEFETGLFQLAVFDKFNRLEKFIKTAIQVNKLPFAFLFNGSLESQLVLKIANRVMKKESKWGLSPHVFSIHLKDNSFPESINQFLVDQGVISYGYTYTVDQAFAAIPKIVYLLETASVDIVLEAIPTYLLLDKIQKGFYLKYLYSSLGLDEYRDFPDRATLKTRFQGFSEKYSALGNKLPSGFGIQFDSPLIQSNLVELIYRFNADFWDNTYKNETEDYHFVREMGRQFGIHDKDGETAFREERTTLQNALETKVSSLVTNQEFGTGLLLFPTNPPTSKLDYYFRKIYMGYFGNK